MLPYCVARVTNCSEVCPSTGASSILSSLIRAGVLLMMVAELHIARFLAASGVVFVLVAAFGVFC